MSIRFFFSSRRRHTRFDCDWSSDVCSSDLEVVVLEGMDKFLSAVDEQIAKEAKKAFDKQGLKIELGVKIGEIKSGKKGVSIAYTNAKGEAQALEADKLIISIGRTANTAGLNAEAVDRKSTRLNS